MIHSCPVYAQGIVDTIVWGQKSIKSICADDALEKGWAATAIKESLLGLF